MKTLPSIEALRAHRAHLKSTQQPVALVPTMGNLHDGHLSLVEAAKRSGGHVVVSIFVNPTQFGANEDFDTYPRTLEEDCQKLKHVGADAVFTPTADEIYPKDQPKMRTQVSLPHLASLHCGAHRPGHFDGVATIVTKLFHLVEPSIAYFGQKDFQQLLLIKTMAEDLMFPIEVIGLPTCRDDDGLALSSRNQYLTPQERALAPLLFDTLSKAKANIIADLPHRDIESAAIDTLTKAGFDPEYFQICNACTLHPTHGDETAIIVLAAAKLGTTRLIDNIIVNLG